MAKKRKGGKRKRKISIFAAAGAAIGIKFLWGAYKSGGVNKAFMALTGYDLVGRTFDIKRASAGIAFFGGAVASMVAAKTGINRYLNIPWFKL